MAAIEVDQVLLGLFSGLAGMVLVLLLARRRAPAAASVRRTASQAVEGTALLFERGDLIDATEEARHFLRGSGPPAPGGYTLADAVARLRRSYPGLPAQLPEPGAPPGRAHVAGRFGTGPLLVEWWDDKLRLDLSPDLAEATSIHPATLEAMSDDVDLLRLISEETPELIWRLDAEGQVTWANRSYLARADGLAEPGAWPPAALFRQLPDPGGPARRLRLVEGAEEHWYDVHVRSVPPDRLCVATPADQVIAAQRQAEEFLTTMSRIFAELSVGLLIFDTDRRLTMFNPAAYDMLGLGSAFLTGRPPLRDVLDRLRDRGLVPEPRDWRSWRERFDALEEAGERGQLSESWSLPGNRTWRVTGRPHPGGALALLFEDISDEIGQTRRFRAELETGRGVLDALPDGIAVFSPAGTLRMTNTAYDTLWGRSSDTLDDVRLADEIGGWEARCTGVSALRRMGGTDPVAAAGGAPIALRRKDGRAAELHLSRIPRGDILARFHLSEGGIARPAPGARTEAEPDPGKAAGPDGPATFVRRNG
ncbi:PAS-domain containing protein [Wenxinia saemankumensis]|uniref:PAS domain-containing protein n=1 Tax=Wenxinia saemankumensis TaxID=1447782 RepID=A0A1M6G3K1_9RHOB|nr:PAS-domain containing protein [Wenxinia saemankumensis]SHJ04422.1 PAS domain-containing protein [Wenxinia saemankumensis]